MYERTSPLTIKEATFIKNILENPIVSKQDGSWVCRTRIDLDNKLDVDNNGNIIVPNGMVLNDCCNLVERPEESDSNTANNSAPIKLDERGMPIKVYRRPNDNRNNRHRR